MASTGNNFRQYERTADERGLQFVPLRPHARFMQQRPFAGVPFTKIEHTGARQVCMLGNLLLCPASPAQVDYMPTPLVTYRMRKRSHGRCCVNRA
ncbi:MAG: hypothetical protein E5299_01870 [Burkholderia gladioli]|nr:MAG: hypothetical protein E5299_01870 [Burkholderia gladioli]